MSEKDAEIGFEQVVRKIHDNGLHFLVKIANFAGSNNGVTLLSKGSLISGVIISDQEYFESLASSFGPRGESAPALSEYFWQRAEQSLTPEDIEKDIEFNFINLREVKINSNSGSFVKMHGAFLRMKLEEVDGFILGTLSD
ncbi:hypothetical protein [uncultured Pantoea sp.]|uniref:hypothetical protein n=1 Tax=uncultured Pantoea sp. TaxID=218084 RepID=UPI0025825C5B|nr:hypothetical protein [uncultured Pantoea sp.]